MRVGQAVAEAAEALSAAGIATPRVDAELLTAFVLGLRRGQLVTAPDLTGAQVATLRTLTAQRAAHVPVQHLTGTAPFRHLELAVGPGVFIPRPETELLVEWGLRQLPDQPAPLVIDLCAGSGAIAAAIATEAPGARVYAVELERAALAWLARNTGQLPIRVITADATDPATLAELDGRVDLVLSNPPYVPEIGAAGLPREVTDHDPHTAVFGGVDGLAVIRPLIRRVAALLRPGGAVGIEHDDTHAYVVPSLLHVDGRFAGIELHHDLARRPRFTTARRAETRP